MNNISSEGGNIIYIRENQTGVIEYSLNNTNIWTTVPFSNGCIITNNNISLGFLKIYFVNTITITNVNQYFIYDSDYIQFGSEYLNPDGTRTVIKVNADNYNGFIAFTGIGLGYNNILIFNLFVNAKNETKTYTTSASGGWIASFLCGSSIYIINCSSNGDIGQYGGGIIGSFITSENNGCFYIIGCSSSGKISQNAGGIIG